MSSAVAFLVFAFIVIVFLSTRTKERRNGVPKTDEERLATHQSLFPNSGVLTVSDLPPRGTGNL